MILELQYRNSQDFFYSKIEKKLQNVTVPPQKLANKTPFQILKLKASYAVPELRDLMESKQDFIDLLSYQSPESKKELHEALEPIYEFLHEIHTKFVPQLTAEEI